MRFMKQKMFKRILFIILSLFAVVLVGGCVYLAIPYEVEAVALEIEEYDNVTVEGSVTQIRPEEDTDVAIIFYPGSKVESKAYLPLFAKVVEETGVTCFLVDMPFNQAFFDSDAAEDIITQHEEIDHWYMAGHSLGGSMASDYASKNQKQIAGVIVLGSYVYGDYPTDKSLTVYGTFNRSVEDGIDYTDNIVVIEGGNHAQFGNYGKQPGDPDATITAEEQQDITVEAIHRFLREQGAIE